MEGENSSFPYSPIDTKSKEFRLLLIAPGEAQESLDCVLLHALFSVKSAYKALSYTWGNVTASRPINLEGHTFLVTRNLESALRGVRQPDREECIWVDAICINQTDLAERSEHITYMHHVYQCAEQVLVWLGEASEDSDLAIDELQILGTHEGHADSTTRPHQGAMGASSNPMKRLTAISRFFARPWWSRVWVLQEIVWASDILVLCGRREVTWGTLHVASSKLPHLVSKTELAESAILNLAFSSTIGLLTLHRTLRVESLPISLEHTLTRVTVRSSTDPRDKVFGILNIVPISEWPFKPDYSRNTRSIYVAVAKHILTKSRKLTLLSCCQQPRYPIRQDHLRKKYQRQSLAGLPTWVPDWTRRRLDTGFCGSYENDALYRYFSKGTPYAAAGQSSASLAFSDDDQVLTVKGVCYDVVERTAGPFLKRPGDLADYSNGRLYERLDSFTSEGLKNSERFRDQPTRSEALWRTMIANRTYDGAKASAEYGQRFMDWRSAKQDSNPPETFIKLIFVTCNSRRIFTTRRGLIGLGPLNATPGDLVCVLLGSSIPMIIRRSHLAYMREKDLCKVHQDISDCFIHGCLNSQFLVGPEPENILIGAACKLPSLNQCLDSDLPSLDVHGIMEGEVMQELAENKVSLVDIALH
jgi:Heterokaryon incompatibility protein (HET)